MLTKSIFTVAAFAVALPFTAFAAGSNGGQAMQAALLNVDASNFTANELARIDAEKGDQRKADRAALILDQRAGVPSGANGGQAMQAALLNVDASAFTTNELARIDAEKGDQRKLDRARQILREQNGATVSTLGDSAVRAGYVHIGRDDR